eukprot:gene11668-34382_t
MLKGLLPHLSVKASVRSSRLIAPIKTGNARNFTAALSPRPMSLPRTRRSPAPLNAFNAASIEDGFGGKIVLPNGMVDHYVVLGVDDDALPSEIKRAYRNMARECHPDFLGEAGHDICIMLNEAYSVLMDPNARMEYDAKLEQALIDDDDEFHGKMLSKWMPEVDFKRSKHEDPYERRAVFVDEFTCIGCKNCAWCASATFRMEPEHGRSRVFAQWLDNEDKIQESIDTCPVACIHWVDKDDLPALEFVTQMKITERTNVGVMMAGNGSVVDVFQATKTYLRQRAEKEERMASDVARRAYSPAQEASRRAAAEALREKNLSGFASWASSSFDDLLQGAFGSIQSQVDGRGSSPDYEELKKVGKRKRTQTWDEVIRKHEESGSRIPLDRSLVLSSTDMED